MAVVYNPETNAIEIEDKERTQYFLIIGLMLINLFNATVNLYNTKDRLGALSFIWVSLLLISTGVLLFYLFKKTTINSIPLDRIKRLRQRSLLGKTWYSLELKNGKCRDLQELHSKAELFQVRKMLLGLGVSE
ncbi:hypothetical protein [Croceivirga radicis]|uniref:Uncharacterized protein n=1 Tax=Croceivirga radicis TaxID=1929488 RepID=A0A1V6LNQ5_9FLAO|nr:hypothetical protein [Croceivirga radicis]OQD41739.1 hypothetical protein BUL40_14160 [Croceivirga radicis]